MAAMIPGRTKKKRPLFDDDQNILAEKPSADQKKEKPTNEIDEIFQKAKKQPKEEAQPKSSDGSSKPKKSGEVGPGDKKKKTKKKKKGTPPVVEETSEARARRRRTGDGLTIYSAEELGFGNPEAGGTPLCPFDCSCCF